MYMVMYRTNGDRLVVRMVEAEDEAHAVISLIDDPQEPLSELVRVVETLPPYLLPGLDTAGTPTRPPREVEKGNE